MVIKNPNIRKLKNIVIRIAIVVIAYLALYYQLRRNGNLSDLWSNFLLKLSAEKSLIPLAAVILMMTLNWSLEAIKWRLLIRKSERISFFRSLKGILTGISVGTFTPNRIGEFLGRSFVLDRSHPWKVFFMTMIGSYSQLLTTIVFGACGLLLFSYKYSWLSTGFTYLDILITFFVLATVAFVVLLYFNIHLLDKLFGPWLRKRKPGFASWFHVIATYSSGELLLVMFFSICRYAVFSAQFFILLNYFGLPLTLWNTLIFTSVTYLVASLIPSMALSEIGIRGSVALFFFGFYFSGNIPDNDSAIAIVSTSSLLWLINVVIPAITGTFFIYHLKVFRNNKTNRK